MTVQDLILELEKVDPDLPVVALTGDHERTLSGVEFREDAFVIWVA